MIDEIRWEEKAGLRRDAAQDLKSWKTTSGKLAVERAAIHRKTDAIKPFVHFGGILAHANSTSQRSFSKRPHSGLK
jgi:hypothetical protein